MRRTLFTASIIMLGLLPALPARAQAIPPAELVKAAQGGDPIQEWALGHFYLTSTSDKKQAYTWLKKAADAGQLNAKVELDANFGASGSTPFGDAQVSGIVKRAADAKALVLPTAPDTRLAMFVADNDSPPQYIFYSPEQSKQVTVLDVKGSLVTGPSTPGSINAALPGTFIDLPQAIAAARGQGMQGNIQSARLGVAQAKNKAPIAIWTLMPQDTTQHNGLAYFVGAKDGRPLGLMDVSDGIPANDAQLRAAYAAAHPQTDNNSGGSMGSSGTVSRGFNANAAYAESQRRAYNYEMFQGDSARADNCRTNGC
jgi:TPR repeat protein